MYSSFLCGSGYNLAIVMKFFIIVPLSLGQLLNCPNAICSAMKTTDEWIHKNHFCNHNKTQHNKTISISHILYWQTYMGVFHEPGSKGQIWDSFQLLTEHFRTRIHVHPWSPKQAATGLVLTLFECSFSTKSKEHCTRQQLVGAQAMTCVLVSLQAT